MGDKETLLEKQTIPIYSIGAWQVTAISSFAPLMKSTGGMISNEHIYEVNIGSLFTYKWSCETLQLKLRM